jgi:hypothetical protein
VIASHILIAVSFVMLIAFFFYVYKEYSDIYISDNTEQTYQQAKNTDNGSKIGTKVPLTVEMTIKNISVDLLTIDAQIQNTDSMRKVLIDRDTRITGIVRSEDSIQEIEVNMYELQIGDTIDVIGSPTDLSSSSRAYKIQIRRPLSEQGKYIGFSNRVVAYDPVLNTVEVTPLGAPADSTRLISISNLTKIYEVDSAVRASIIHARKEISYNDLRKDDVLIVFGPDSNEDFKSGTIFIRVVQ